MNDLISILSMDGGFAVAWDYCLERGVCMPEESIISCWHVKLHKPSESWNGHESDYKRLGVDFIE